MSEEVEIPIPVENVDFETNTIQEALVHAMHRIEVCATHRDSVKGLDLVTTGIIELDDEIMIEVGDLFVVASRQSSYGNNLITLCTTNIVESLSKTEIYYFSSEKTKEQIGLSILSKASNIDITKLKIGNIRKTDWTKLAINADKLSKSKFFVGYNPSWNVDEINGFVKESKNRKLIILDNLWSVISSGSTHPENAQILRRLKWEAYKNNASIIALARMANDVSLRQIRRTSIDMIVDYSGSLESIADHIVGISKNSERSDKLDLSVMKTRHNKALSLAISESLLSE